MSSTSGPTRASAMRRRRRGRVVDAAALLLGVVALLGTATALVSRDPYAVDLEARLRPPAAGHLLGQDTLGRDVLARLVRGARISFGVGLATLLLSAVAGIALGAVAGYAGGWVDEVLTRVIDVVLAFPGLLLAIALAAVLGPSLPNVVLALSLLGWTGYARVARAEVNALRRRDFVVAAEALGAGPLRVIVRHLLPLAAPALLVQATFGLSGAIVAEASLSFLGLGAPAPLPSWGAMLAEGRSVLLVAPHLTLFPGLALATTILALQRLGDGLRDALDVREDP
jgi:peptide/nickel transport system permease protein